jgi:hypothetical protein
MAGVLEAVRGVAEKVGLVETENPEKKRIREKYERYVAELPDRIRARNEATRDYEGMRQVDPPVHPHLLARAQWLMQVATDAVIVAESAKMALTPKMALAVKSPQQLRSLVLVKALAALRESMIDGSKHCSIGSIGSRRAAVTSNLDRANKNRSEAVRKVDIPECEAALAAFEHDEWQPLMGAIDDLGALIDEIKQKTEALKS